MAKNILLKRFATSARAEVAHLCLALQIAECPPLLLPQEGRLIAALF